MHLLQVSFGAIFWRRWSTQPRGSLSTAALTSALSPATVRGALHSCTHCTTSLLFGVCYQRTSTVWQLL